MIQVSPYKTNVQYTLYIYTCKSIYIPEPEGSVMLPRRTPVLIRTVMVWFCTRYQPKWIIYIRNNLYSQVLKVQDRTDGKVQIYEI